MARLTPRRVCRYGAVLILVIIVYMWLASYDDSNHITASYTEEDIAKSLLIGDFWVPEKGLEKSSGPGDGGLPVETRSEETKESDASYAEYGFNQFISDKISLDRTIPDTRPKQ